MAILIFTRNICQHILYTTLIILYGGNTYKIQDYLTQNRNFTEITEQTLYNIRVSIVIPFILNLFILFSYLGCYYNFKNKNNTQHPVTICSNIGEIGEINGIMKINTKKNLKEVIF